MVTFEKHIINILNRIIDENGKHGEFFFVKNYKEGRMPIMKTLLVTLHYKSPGKGMKVWQQETSLAIKTEDIPQGYEQILEVFLYNLLNDKELWNLISTRLP